MKRFTTGLLAGLCIGAVAGVGVAGLWPVRASAVEETGHTPEQQGIERPSDAAAVRVTPAMVRHSNIRYALHFAGAFWNMAALWLLLQSKFSARLRDFADRYGRNRVGRAFIYYPLFLLAYGTLTLPLVFYSGYVVPHQFGLSNQTFPRWLMDGLKAFALAAALGSPVVALLYWTIHRSPRRWWIGFWLASIPLMAVLLLLGPLLIDPLFNRYQPLRNADLREKILALAARAGIERGRVFEMDASKRTRETNAYVTGIGGSARIVLWDTLLEKMDEDEILAVMAHEMGHYAERHVPILFGVWCAGSLVLLWVANRFTRLLLARGDRDWSTRGLEDMASFPALLLTISLLEFFGTPVQAAVSRTIEWRADRFCLRLTGNGPAAASAFVKLSQDNLSHPSPPPFIEYWMFGHPPLEKRIRAALDWHSSEPPQ